MEKLEKLYTPEEVAKYLGISYRFCLRILKDGKIGHVRLGSPPPDGAFDKRPYRVSESDLAEFYARFREAPKLSGVHDLSVREWRRQSAKKNQPIK